MSKKHWLSKILEPACFFSEGDDEERFNVKAERLILDTIKSKLPEERFHWEGMGGIGTEDKRYKAYNVAEASFNECLKLVKEALLGEE